MGFDDWLKDLLDDIDWTDVVGSVLRWIIAHPNVYQAGYDAIVTLIRVAWRVKDMGEEAAKESFMANIGELEALPLLQMNFSIDGDSTDPEPIPDDPGPE